MKSGSPVAIGERVEGEKREERECYKMRTVVLPFALAGVRIEEGKIDGATGELLWLLKMLLTCGPHTSVRKRRGEGAGLACWAGPGWLARPALFFFFF